MCARWKYVSHRMRQAARRKIHDIGNKWLNNLDNFHKITQPKLVGYNFAYAIFPLYFMYDGPLYFMYDGVCVYAHFIVSSIITFAWTFGMAMIVKILFRQRVHTHIRSQWARNVHSFNRLDDLIRLFSFCKIGFTRSCVLWLQ